MTAKPVPAEDIDPLPQNFPQAKSITRKQHSEILTSTPKKRHLEDSDKKKRTRKKGERKLSSGNRKKVTRKEAS
jgi:hypothetical protein